APASPISIRICGTRLLPTWIPPRTCLISSANPITRHFCTSRLAMWRANATAASSKHSCRITRPHDPDFEVEKEWQALRAVIQESEAQAESGNITDELRRVAIEKPTAAKSLAGTALDNQIRKNRTRWLRQTLTDAGTRRAHELGWPNTYTLTKGISESLIAKRG